MSHDGLTSYQRNLVARAGYYAARDVAVPIDLEASLQAEGLSLDIQPINEESSIG